MFSKRRFRRRNKPSSQNLLESGEQQQETPFIPPVQTKLNIGKPGDVYEVEADKTADAVVAQTDTADSVQKMGTEEEEELQAKPLAAGLTPFIQKQEATEEEESVQTMAEKEEEEPVQMQEEEEEHIQAKCEACEKEDKVQKMEAEEKEPVQAKGENYNAIEKGLSTQLKVTKGSGSNMNESTKSEMEQAFGNDFSKVNIHTDAKAKAMNKQLNAQAFTHGNDIYFNSGKYNPNTTKGKHLLAHELTHTIQQRGTDSEMSAEAKNGQERIQREPIDYRELTWDDFKGPVDEESSKSASTAYAIDLDPQPGFISAKPSWDGSTTATVTISYNPSLVIMKGIFETDESWKKPWLTNDEAALKEFGPNVNIDTKRANLLAHEQIHFKIAETMAKSYLLQIKAVIPATPYTETGPAKSESEVNAFTEKVLNKKADEIHNAIGAIKAEADTVVKAVQDLYDLGTVHSKKIKKQEKWQDQFDAMLKAAIVRAKADIAAQNQGAPPGK